MSDNLFLKLLLTIMAGLIAAELAVVLVAGLRLELIVLCFIVAAALGGILFIVRQLFLPRPEVETVSMRRARAMKDEHMRRRLGAYDVDREFMGASSSKHDRGCDPEQPACACSDKPSALEGFSMEKESFDQYIRKSMSNVPVDSPEFGEGIPLNIDFEGAPKGRGSMPADFSHDPRGVIENMKRLGADS
ncbi:MAG: hypothetical protein WCH05_01475 [Chlorobiaceae bacterium]